MDIAESASLKQVVVSEGEAGRHVLRRQNEYYSNGNYAGFILAASAALSREGHVL